MFIQNAIIFGSFNFEDPDFYLAEIRTKLKSSLFVRDNRLIYLFCQGLNKPQERIFPLWQPHTVHDLTCWGQSKPLEIYRDVLFSLCNYSFILPRSGQTSTGFFFLSCNYTTYLLFNEVLSVFIFFLHRFPQRADSLQPCTIPGGGQPTSRWQSAVGRGDARFEPEP